MWHSDRLVDPIINHLINLPFRHGLYNPFMLIYGDFGGMVYEIGFTTFLHCAGQLCGRCLHCQADLLRFRWFACAFPMSLSAVGTDKAQSWLVLVKFHEIWHTVWCIMAYGMLLNDGVIWRPVHNPRRTELGQLTRPSSDYRPWPLWRRVQAGDGYGSKRPGWLQDFMIFM